MNKYIIVRTLCDKKEIANQITNSLLEKKLIAGSQTSEVHSKYWWKNYLEECSEYKLEFRTKLSRYKEIPDISAPLTDIFRIEPSKALRRS